MVVSKISVAILLFIPLAVAFSLDNPFIKGFFGDHEFHFDLEPQQQTSPQSGNVPQPQQQTTAPQPGNVPEPQQQTSPQEPRSGSPQLESGDLMQGFLDAHNKARAQVGVPPLKWNTTIADYAQKYASVRAADCALTHSEGPYGENIAFASWDLSPAEAVKMWVDEKQYFDFKTKAWNDNCMHFSQIVWHNTVSVGCAKVHCKTDSFFVTCNYDPPGNFYGEKPY